MTAAYTIRPISAEQTYPLRLRILRVGYPDADVNYPSDANPGAYHLGAFADDTLIGIASIYPEPMQSQAAKRGWRLRGMAVDTHWQRKGIGDALLEACFAHIDDHNGELFWCYGRTSAFPFYKKKGFQTEGSEWIDPMTGPHYVMWRTI